MIFDAAHRLSAELLVVDLAALRFEGREIVRRLGVRVRDPSWATIAGEIESISASDGSAVRTVTRHRGETIDVRCRTTIDTHDGGLTCALEAETLMDVRYARIGLVVMLPPAAVIGRRYRALTPDGWRSGRIERLIGPQRIIDGRVRPLFDAFSDLEIGDLRFTFEGDLFELEDQRNWTDGSFKIYSTPVDLPLPHRLPATARIRQRVTIECGVRCKPPRPPNRRTTEKTHVPEVGAAIDSDGHTLTGHEAAKLRAIGLAHVRVDVGAETLDAELARAATVTHRLDVPLELAVHLRGSRRDAAAVADRVASGLDAHRLRCARALVFHEDEPVTDPRWLTIVDERLGVPVAGGTDIFFADLNRTPQAFATAVFPVTPQVHDSDERTMMDALEVLGDVVDTARCVSNATAVYITPITLRPRVNPFVAQPAPGRRIAAADERQTSNFAAAWTVGALAALARARVAGVTCFELTGDRGIVERGSGIGFSVGAVLAAVAAWRGLVMLPCDAPDGVAVLAVRDAGRPAAIVANLRPSPEEVELGAPFDGRVLDLLPYGVARVG